LHSSKHTPPPYSKFQHKNRDFSRSFSKKLEKINGVFLQFAVAILYTKTTKKTFPKKFPQERFCF